MKLRLHHKAGCSPLSLVYQTFNDLTVVRKTTERQDGHVIYECRCVCGQLTRVRATRLANNITKSCGKCQRTVGTITTTIPFEGESKNGYAFE